MSRAITEYSDRMRKAVDELLGEGDRVFTQAMLIERMGCKVTPSFRKRLDELEAAGVIEKWRFHAGGSSYPIAYSRPGEWVNAQPVWRMMGMFEGAK